jgi:hypothetical protein
VANYDSVLDELVGLMDQFVNTVFVSIKTWSNQQVHFQRLDGTTKLPVNGPVFTHVFQADEGLVPNDALPGFNAGIISWYTGFGGRSQRGRTYFPGVSEDATSLGILDANSFNDLTAIGTEMFTRFVASSPAVVCWELVLFHPTLFHLGTPIASCVSKIAKFQARREVRSQRHRMLGHGP